MCAESAIIHFVCNRPQKWVSILLHSYSLHLLKDLFRSARESRKSLIQQDCHVPPSSFEDLDVLCGVCTMDFSRYVET